MSRKKRSEFSETYKLEVLREYYSGNESMNAVCKRHGIHHSLLYHWKKAFPIEEFSLSLPPGIIESYKMAHDKKTLSNEEILQKRIDDLERSLKYEQMRSKAFLTMIEITEREEGISILKKGGAKQ